MNTSRKVIHAGRGTVRGGRHRGHMPLPLTVESPMAPIVSAFLNAPAVQKSIAVPSESGYNNATVQVYNNTGTLLATFSL